MKTEKKTAKKSLIRLGRGRISVIVYIVVCLAGMFILISFFNRLIEKHDRSLSQQTCSLMAEKVTASLSYLRDSASDMSAIAAADANRDYDTIYGELKKSAANAGYSSMGLILRSGEVYAAEPEQNELKRQGIITDALAMSDRTIISKPYRSVMSGQIVFTVTSSIMRDGEDIGSVFVTYDFNKITDLAQSENIDSNAEVWLMDVTSLNVIRCSGPKAELNGNWSNLNLNDEVSKSAEYIECIKNIQRGAPSASVSYTDSGEMFTQVFRKLDCMDGWSVAVRIPNRTFSSTMLDFRAAVVIFSLVVIGATGFLLIAFRWRSAKEKEMLEDLTKEVIKAFATAVDFNDPYTAGHSKRVGEYSREIAKRLGLKEDECRDVYYCGLLHDVGKLGIDNTIINKPDKLTGEEFDEIKKHPNMGYEILKGISIRESYAAGAMYHHERVDGKGYPSHTKDIPLVGRIISVADAYDAMTSKRSYRDALPQEAVREQIEKNAGTQFDEKIAKIMLQMIDEDTNYEMRQK